MAITNHRAEVSYTNPMLVLFTNPPVLREAAKKKVTPLVAGPLRGGGVKAGPL